MEATKNNGTSKSERRYTVTEHDWGIRVTGGDDRAPVSIIKLSRLYEQGYPIKDGHALSRDAFDVNMEQNRLPPALSRFGDLVMVVLAEKENRLGRQSFALPIVNFYEIASAVANVTLWRWDPPKDGFPQIRKWAKERLSIHMRLILANAWKNLLTDIPDSDLALAKRTWSVTFGLTPSQRVPYLTNRAFEDPYIQNEIMTYRPAAWLAGMPEDFIGSFAYDPVHTQILQELGKSLTKGPGVFGRFYDAFWTPETFSAAWRRFFGMDNRSARRTLAQMPSKTGTAIYTGLAALNRRVPLRAPIFDRLVLIFYAALDSHLTLHNDAYALDNGMIMPPCPIRYSSDELRNFDREIFHRTQYIQREELEAAVWRFLEITGEHTAQIKARHVRRTAQYIADYLNDYPPASAFANLTALMHDAIEWHDTLPHFAMVDNRSDDEPVVPPPTLPDPKNGTGTIRFLGTVGDIRREGNAMHHCVGSHAYLDMALAGQGYLFHVEYKNEVATAHVSASGQVIQIYGPCNEKNAACHWGASVLKRWGKSLAEIGRVDET